MACTFTESQKLKVYSAAWQRSPSVLISADRRPRTAGVGLNGANFGGEAKDGGEARSTFVCVRVFISGRVCF